MTKYLFRVSGLRAFVFECFFYVSECCLYSAQQLSNFDVSTDDVSWNRVTVSCDSFVCIRHRKISGSRKHQVLLNV